MKKVYSILIAVFGFYFSSAQFIVAGQYDVDDYYADPNPDTVFTLACNETSQWAIDLNGDGITDAEMQARGQCGMTFQNYELLVVAMSNAEIAYGYEDSCLHGNMAANFTQGDTINTDGQWINGELFLYKQYYSIAGAWLCTNNSFINSGYVGARVFLADDTIYAWIKVSVLPGMFTGSLTIDAYASNLEPTSIKRFKASPFTITPNPATNYLTLHAPGKVHDLKFAILNVYGQTISSGLSKQENGNVIIDIGSFAAGIYFLEACGQWEKWTGKFIKQ